MGQDADISWQLIREIARTALNDPQAEVASVSPLTGGCVSTTVAIELKTAQKIVLKITPHRVDRSYEDEALQLQMLRDADIPVPRVFLQHTGSLDAPFSYIVMEFIEGVDLHAARSASEPDVFDALQQELAELVKKLHQIKADHYHRITTQEVRLYESWPHFYGAIFEPICREVQELATLPVKTRRLAAKLHDRLWRYLDHDDCPRLTHWDLWSTNILARKQEDGSWHVAALLDPNCKYAHVEAELAYLELFHTVTPAFLKAYQTSQRLSDDYQKLRKPIYQFYSMLHHLTLFGPQYLKPACAAAERVAALI